MNRISIYTNSGQFVAEGLIPPFQTPVEVIVWGTRIFLLRDDGLYKEAAGSSFLLTPPKDHDCDDVIVRPAAGVGSSGKMKTTTDGKPPAGGDWDGPAPKPIDPETGQHGAYYVLTEEERAKGFVRPVRTTYIHAGPRKPKYPLRDLTDVERELYGDIGYVKFEVYGEEMSPKRGHYWTQEELDRAERGCGAATTMSRALAETYARDPDFYGGTFCCACKEHYRVKSRDQGGEFYWFGSGPTVLTREPDYDDPSYIWVGT